MFQVLRLSFSPFVKGDSGGFDVQKDKSILSTLFLGINKKKRSLVAIIKHTLCV